MSLFNYINSLPEKREILQYETADEAYEAGWKIKERLMESGECALVDVQTTYCRVRLSLKEVETSEQEVR